MLVRAYPVLTTLIKTLGFGLRAIVIAIFACLSLQTTCFSQEQPPTSFLPTWKLLNTEQKQQFIAGYLKASRDAGEVLDIAIAYVRDNPAKALEGLAQLRGIYAFGNAISPVDLAREVDKFYSDGDNKNKPLSVAISSVKTRASLP